MKLGNFDFSEFEKLQKRMKNMEKEWPLFMESCIKELGARLLAKTSARTPVDTNHLRSNWMAGVVNHLPSGGVQIEISNPVEYAKYVEYGHVKRNRVDWVDGKFMLTISSRELEEQLPAILNKKIKQYIDKHMG
ncbi:HK97 gp10 family phage protein [Paenibacillus shunpengii]|uniref:HK97 gp10 family phage protein n=1 Tax=Paenibacillus shunpengii TaxID=2054424 RepID=A0ABW5SWX8_9BACL